MTEPRTFPLADVLSVTTGCLLSRTRMDGMGTLLNYLTGQDTFAKQLIPAQQFLKAADTTAPVLVEQHPFLADLKPPAEIDAPDLMAWLIDAERVHGEEITVVSVASWKNRKVAAMLKVVGEAVASASVGIRQFNEAVAASEVREVATHPDLAELNAQVDGYYDKPV
ncbi:hypothetical protein HY68_36470 [Streptomyces sp. AcH 505]|uniref:DUF7736 domain-containing protein n=1 Tax=Streptomyces sp. AcH 505 TaxID=352211 RepID=UPI000592299C|nr:hypothetical protein HY68_36470 [Streptomyces sp. AcH 505]